MFQYKKKDVSQVAPAQDSHQGPNTKTGRFLTGLAYAGLAVSAACGATTRRVDPTVDRLNVSGPNLNSSDATAIVASAMKDIEDLHVIEGIRTKKKLGNDEPLRIVAVAVDNETSIVFNRSLFTGNFGYRLSRASFGEDYKPASPDQSAAEEAQRIAALKEIFGVEIIDRSNNTLNQVKTERDAKFQGAVDGNVTGGIAAAHVFLTGNVRSMEFVNGGGLLSGKEDAKTFWVTLNFVDADTSKILWSIQLSTAFISAQNILSR